MSLLSKLLQCSPLLNAVWQSGHQRPSEMSRTFKHRDDAQQFVDNQVNQCDNILVRKTISIPTRSALVQKPLRTACTSIVDSESTKSASKGERGPSAHTQGKLLPSRPRTARDTIDRRVRSQVTKHYRAVSCGLRAV